MKATNFRTAERLSIACATLLLFAVSACDSASSKQSTQTSNGAVTGAYENLLSALGACGREAGQCAQQAAGDDSALGVCRDDLNACRESAGDHASHALADAIRMCTDSALECKKSASDAGQGACHDALRACLSASRPASQGDDDGGGSASEHGAAIASCVDALHACVEADMQPMVCAEQMRSCVLAAVPAPSDVTPGGPTTPGHPDAGHSGETSRDAGHADAPRADAGHAVDAKPVDAGHGSDMGAHPDAGMPDDAGAACMKHMQACLDGGNTTPACHAQQPKCGKGQ